MYTKEAVIYKLEFYRAPRGTCPVREFLGVLPDRLQMKVAAWLGMLQEQGPQLHRPYSDVVQGPIRELRISLGRLEVRLLYFFHGSRIIVTHGFLKKCQRLPPMEIKRAHRYRAAWLASTEGDES